MILSIFELAGTTQLGGASHGRRVFAQLLDAMGDLPTEPTVLFLDMARLEIATASFIREAFFAFKSRMRMKRTTIYPVIANANDIILEEFAVVAEATNDAIISCRLDDARRAHSVRLIGDLDPKQQMTLDAVMKQREADASSLMNQFGEQEKTKHTTAWNNRLSALVARGLLREFSQGRAKTYRPLFEEVA